MNCMVSKRWEIPGEDIRLSNVRRCSRRSVCVHLGCMYIKGLFTFKMVPDKTISRHVE